MTEEKAIGQPEKTILEFIVAETGNEELAVQAASARVRKRDYTRTGVFLYFVPDEAAEPVPVGVRPVAARLDAPGLPDGAGCELFLRNGRLHYLEVYARGGFFPEALDDYRVSRDD